MREENRDSRAELTPADFIRIPYTPDFTQAGVIYALQALASGLLPAGNLGLDPLHNMIADVAAALAFRRCLAEYHVPYRTLEVTPFSQPGLEQVILNGHGCHLINRTLDSRSWTDDPSRLCAAPASLSKAQLHSDRLASVDLLVFTYSTLQRGTSRGGLDPSHPRIYRFPATWRKPPQAGSNTPGSLSFESAQEMVLEIGGLGVDGQIQTEDLQLIAHQRTPAGMDFSTLAYLATKDAPTRMVIVRWDKITQELQVLPKNWEKAALDWKEMVLAGYMTVGDFRHHARRIHPARNLTLGIPFPSQAVYLPVGDLLPLSQLFAWAMEQ